MGKRVFRGAPALIAFLIYCFAPANLPADPIRIGGYDVSRIAAATTDVLKTKGVLSDADATKLAPPLDSENASDPLVASQSIVNFYDKLGAMLIEKKIFTAEDAESVKIPARASGGMKAGGLNPVVLAAAFLDELVKKGIISVDTAQTILDGAK